MVDGGRPFFGFTENAGNHEMYEQIVTGNLKFPAKFSLPLRQVLRGLLTVKASKRLGNLEGGIFDIISDRLVDIF